MSGNEEATIYLQKWRTAARSAETEDAGSGVLRKRAGRFVLVVHSPRTGISMQDEPKLSDLPSGDGEIGHQRKKKALELNTAFGDREGKPGESTVGADHIDRPNGAGRVTESIPSCVTFSGAPMA
jgi:hypothetical protein